ncbi:MAG: DUF6512 family protein [Candidatus Odinarchaeum yellowstonii]|uniref:DUF6512 family protein n=1 Tax=Odinarchaeota yellowstonii (strain LCB_4) TaxID=1841599 RepID=A0AAF0D218_ODILC|nr:MAG: DUF6512 family protein [Candidatus Odinarchaeum yellowstonii]
MHFAFEFSGGFTLVGVFAAVNESVYEHLKLGFWPAVFFIPLEYSFVKGKVNNFMLAKTAAALIIPASIIGIFYLYSTILGGDLLILDLATFIIAVIIGQVAGYKILSYRMFSKRVERGAVIVLIVFMVVFPLLTFYPPEMFIFQDPVSGLYGIHYF